MVGIYKITNTLNDKCYIGQSIDIETRWIQHIHEGKHNTQKGKLYPAIFQNGIENFIFEVIEECPLDQEILNKKERYWIKFYNSFEDGYNSTIGGQGEDSWTYNPDLICQLWDKGYSTGEIVQVIGCSHTTVQSRLKNYKNYNSEESRFRSHCLNTQTSFAKDVPIYQYSINGNYIASYHSISQAARAVNGMKNNIISCLNNSQKLAYGYQWSKEKVDKLSPVRPGRGRLVRCINTNQIFYSMIEAAKWAGLKSNSSIKDCCKGRNKTAGKHPETGERLHWEYVN